MVDDRTLNCIRESEVDTIEIALNRRMEDLLSEGDVHTAEIIEETIKSLDKVNICDESSKFIRDLAYSGRIKDKLGR